MNVHFYSPIRYPSEVGDFCIQDFMDCMLATGSTQEGSMVFLGGLLGFMAAGWLMARLGRWWSLLLSTLPSALGCIIVSLSLNPLMLLTGRFVDGMSFGMIGVVVRTYVSEIADPGIRGSAMIVANLFIIIGSILVLTLGLLMTWYYVMFISVIITLIHSFLILTVLPESPTFLAVNGRDAEALVILHSLRGAYADINEEVRILKSMNQREDGRVGWGAVIKPDIVKKIITLSALFLVSNFSGVQVLKANTARMLGDSGMALGKIVSTILVNVVFFAGIIFMMFLLDRLGRKRCLILSLTLLMVAYISFGTHVFISDSQTSSTIVEVNMDESEDSDFLSYQSDVSPRGWRWVPLVCLMVAAFGQSIGAGPLPWIISSEYFPTIIRSEAVSVCMLLGSLQSFAVMQLFSPMQEALTRAGLYWTYGAVAALGVPFCLIFLTETARSTVG
ncbi:facilitated trehalose transporter Tret1 [Procambarus clarkii]|uniref:facilitated trehalose transporter Tret1 n=1 Tax=Procambarus clarkii TaxID=6728 RepID=UPI0037432BDF